MAAATGMVVEEAEAMADTSTKSVVAIKNHEMIIMRG